MAVFRWALFKDASFLRKRTMISFLTARRNPFFLFACKRTASFWLMAAETAFFH